MVGVRDFCLPRLLRAKATGGIQSSGRSWRAKSLWLSLARMMGSLERWRMAR